VVGVLFEDAEREAAEGAVIDDAEDTEGTVIDLVNGQVAAEAYQGLVQIGGLHRAVFFFPRGLKPVFDGGVGDEDAVVAP